MGILGVTDSKLKIVVAEDHAMQRTFMTMLLNKLGYEAIPAEDGLEALKLVQESDAQILISDFNMPNLNGIELTQEIRKLDLDHHVYVIMLTGLDDDDARGKALEVGVDEFMPKGISPKMLAERLSKASTQVRQE